MDSPDRPRGGAAAGAVVGFEDSPVFNFINSLSPIPPPKPLDSAHNVQLFKSLDFATVSSIFTSPHVNPAKESKVLIRDTSVQLSQESHSPNSVRTRIGTSSSIRLAKCTTVLSDNCSITCHLNEVSVDSSDNTSIYPRKLPQSIQLDGGSLESDKNQFANNKTDLTLDQEQTELEDVLDHSGPDKTNSLSFGRNVQENQLSKQNKDELAACDVDYSIIDQPDETNLENSQGELLHGSSCSHVNNSADDPHVYWTEPVEGAAIDYTTQMQPGACQSQIVPNDQIYNKLNEPSAYVPVDHSDISQHLRGMRRRCLFNEKAGTAKMVLHGGSNLHPASSTPRYKSISGDNNSKPVRTPPCALPGIGLHLNALAKIPKNKILSHDTQSTINQSSNIPCPIGSPSTAPEPNILNDDSSETAIPGNADESGQGSPKKKRHKFENGDAASCKRCSCKKSKCLKLYCECFTAGVFCSEPCSCQGCLNKPSHMETVLSTREQIESRNPLAFAPKVIRTSDPGQELGEDSIKTPASARHKRGCNCKKSSCLKKYCECYQGGVGCSMSCRCEGCKNAFGRREGVTLLSTEETEQREEKNAGRKEEKSENDKQLVIHQTDDLLSTENLLTTPSIEPCRSLVSLLPPSPKQPRSSTKLSGYSSRLCNSQASLKSDIMLSPFESYAEMILGDGTPDILKGDSSLASVKIVSPNKKRISPPRIGTGLSPICKNGRKLILKSIPSFPSLSGDVNKEHPASSSPVP